jgi:FAD/FMN-containing dehydrogenase
MKAKDSYEQKKQNLLSEINNLSERQENKLSLNKTTSNLFRPRSSSSRDKKIDVRNFNQVLSIDPQNLMAEIEGMAQYVNIVNETLKYGYLPTVVPQLKSITVGGAFAGCGIESSSFRYGLVHETIKEAEILLSDGKVISANHNNPYKDLFSGFPNTFGTLGYALKVNLQLIPAKKYVKLTHLRFSQPREYFDKLHALCLENRKDGKISFIDGVIFRKEEMYITLGEFVDSVPWCSNYRFMNIYYKSIPRMKIDYLTTHDYIWRWDPDWFWCSNVFYMQNPVIRFLCGKWLLDSRFYTNVMHLTHKPQFHRFLRLFQESKESVIQDVSIPVESAYLFFEFLFDELSIRPIWICPTQSYQSNVHYDFCPLQPERLYIDFGFWGAEKSNKAPGFYNRKIEAKAKELNGFKSLYSTSYYTAQEFWELYDRSNYTKLKQKYDYKNCLRGLYEKCTTKTTSLK